MRAQMRILSGAAVFFLLGCVKPLHVQPFEDKYAELEAPREVQTEYFEALESLGSFYSQLKPEELPESFTHQGVRCALDKTAPKGSGWALYLESVASCPFELHLSIRFGYNLIQRRVSAEFKSSLVPAENQKSLAFTMGGKGDFRFSSSSDGTRVEGSYQLSGTVRTEAGKVYELEFSNDVHALENQGELVTGQTYSSLGLKSQDWQMGARSLIGHHYGETKEEHRLNREELGAHRAAEAFSQLDLFSPKSISVIGRRYVEEN